MQKGMDFRGLHEMLNVSVDVSLNILSSLDLLKKLHTVKQWEIMR